MVKWLDRAHWLAVTISLLVGFWTIWKLPVGGLVPMHYSATMTPDRWGSPVFGLLALPIVATGLWALQRFLPAVGSPRGAQLASDNLSLAVIRLSVTLLFTLLQLYTASVALSA